jgi:hypothetical protein
MKIYLSEFEVLPEYKRNRNAEYITQQIIEFCENRNIDYFRGDKFKDYQTIEEKIIASDILIAVVDEYWTSSTWKLHEVFFALGDHKGMGTTKIIPKSTDVVLFFSEDISIPILNNITSEVTSFSELDDLIEYLNKNA